MFIDRIIWIWVLEETGVGWLARSYLDLLLEILDVVDGQIQHVGGVGLLQGTGSK